MSSDPSASKRSRSASAQSSTTRGDASVSDQVSADAALAALFTAVRRPVTRGATAAPSPAAPAAAAASSSPAPSPPRSSRAKRKHVALSYDQAANEPAAAAAAASSAAAPSSSAETDTMPALEAAGATAELKDASSSSSSSSGGKKAPAEWKRVYVGIEEMRFRGIAKDAPVDTVGCERLAAPGADDRTRRWHTLVSLMLSSQTKDPVTAQAMDNLHKHWPDGLTVQNIMHCDDHTLDSLINKVGFHNRKTIYLKKTAAICHSQYGGDIPATLEELVALPGVGPKMAHLTLQVAWRNVVGIGVDTHVHRISNRLGWVKSNTPEQTRVQLEQWLPRDYWGAVNVLLVGFGQKVCLPIGPRCADCKVNSLCPTGRANLRYDKRPDKFFPLPLLKTVKQLRQEDEAVAQRELGMAAADASGSGSGGGGDSSSVGGGGAVKMEDEPQRFDDADAAAAAHSPPASSSSAAAAAASATAAAAVSSVPAVKCEAPAHVKQEPMVPESKQTEMAISNPAVQSEQTAGASTSGGVVGVGGGVGVESRSRTSFMRQE